MSEEKRGPTPEIVDAVRLLVGICHAEAVRGGWWGEWQAGDKAPVDVLQLRGRARIGLLNGGAKIALCHSELSEALEGFRKDLPDQHLPHLKSVSVELADAVIRICDLAGALGIDLGQATAEKIAYNARREDHKPKARAAAGGKAF